MNIILNGDNKVISAPANILTLLDALSIEPRKMAVERNLEIVPKSAYSKTQLNEGDRIEIVQFVGGG